MEEAVEEPDNAAPLMHVPTIPVEDAEFVPQKHTLLKGLIVSVLLEERKSQNFIAMVYL